MITNPPSGLDAILATFGSLDDPDFEAKHITLFDLPYPLLYDGKPVTRARCHRLAVENFQKAFRNVMEVGAENQFKEFNGIYARRPIRGYPSHPSTHSWGVSVDMGASTHPLGVWKPWPKEILDAMGDAGFFWGGLFRSRKDCMHFQLATHY